MSHAVTPRILVTGATGYIGGRLLKALEKTTYRLRCLARRPQFLLPRVASSTEVVYGDVREPASLREAMHGVHTAYYLVYSMSSPVAFADADRQAAQSFATAAQQAGVQRLIYLVGLGDSQSQLSPYPRSRQEVGEILRASGVPVIEFRSSIVIGSGSISFEIIRALVERLPVMITPRWVSMRTQPIAIEDVVAYLLAALDLPPRAAQPDLRDWWRRPGMLWRYHASLCPSARAAALHDPRSGPDPAALQSLARPGHAGLCSYWAPAHRQHPACDRGAGRHVPARVCAAAHGGRAGHCPRPASRGPGLCRDALVRRVVNGRTAADLGWVHFGTRVMDSRVAHAPRPPVLAFRPIRQIGGTRG